MSLSCTQRLIRIASDSAGWRVIILVLAFQRKRWDAAIKCVSIFSLHSESSPVHLELPIHSQFVQYYVNKTIF